MNKKKYLELSMNVANIINKFIINTNISTNLKIFNNYMNIILSKLKSWVLMWLWFFLVFWIVNAWTSLTTVNSWDTLTESLWNEVVTKINETWERASWIFTDWNNNVGIGTTTPTSKLDVEWVIKTKGLDTTIYKAWWVNSTPATLSNLNVFANFPDLSLSFNLTEPTTVLSNYRITMSWSWSHMVTRTLVDWVVVSRSITWNTAFWDEEDSWFGELWIGNHTITIQYRTPMWWVSNPSLNDWENRQLQVVVFGS